MVTPLRGAAPDNSTHDDAPSARLLRHALSAQERQYLAVAQVLHNQIGQAVSAIKMTAHLTLDEGDPEQRRQDLQEIIRIADDTVARLRELSNQLRPPQLSALGLEAALCGEVERLGTATAAIDLRISALQPPADPETALACLRTVQQAIVHAQVHAPSAPMEITLANIAADRFGLVMASASDAFAGEGQWPGLELPVLRAHAQTLGGQLQLDRTGQGSTLQLSLPCRAAADA
jgi:glucose-6-phosphate-specific signal transduction histidine kinase